MRTALVCIAKDEDHYIDEWIEYHLKIGFDDIFIYQNDWKYDGKYIDDTRIHLSEVTGRGKQVECYNWFLLTHGNEFSHAAFFDVDEFLHFNRNCDSSLNSLNYFSLSTVLSQKRYSDIAALAIPWRVFGDSGLHFTGTEHSVLKRFIRCGKKYHALYKLIVNLHFMREMNIMPRMINPHIVNAVAIDPNRKYHGVSGFFNDINDGDNVEPIELFHFKNKTIEESRARRMAGKGDAYFSHPKPECQNETTFLKDFKEFNQNEMENTSARDFLYGGE